MSSTIIRLNNINKYALNIRVAAIDGSLHEVNLDNRTLSYIVVGAVFLTIAKEKILYEGSKIIESVEENVKGEEMMRRMEYELANELNGKVDLIFMDRKLSMDKDLGIQIPSNVIGIVKDFDRSSLTDKVNEEGPWMLVESRQDDLMIGYFKFFNWIFMFQTDINDYNYIFNALYELAKEPIPEALGYNYPLFLADKLVKYYRDKYAKTLDFIAGKKITRYRNFRRIVENGRKSF